MKLRSIVLGALVLAGCATQQDRCERFCRVSYHVCLENQDTPLKCAADTPRCIGTCVHEEWDLR